MKSLITFVVLALLCSSTFADNGISKLWEKYSRPELKRIVPQPEPAANGEWPVFFAQFPTRIPMPLRHRGDFAMPEDVGLDKNCPFPTLKKPICYQCPQCGMKSKTHILTRYLPWCGKDNWVLNEIEKW
jgi:hypothetical protein